MEIVGFGEIDTNSKLSLLTKVGLFLNIAPYYGGVNNWKWLLQKLCKQTQTFWIQNEKRFFDFDNEYYQNTHEILKLAKEGNVLQAGDYRSIELIFSYNMDRDLLKRFLYKLKYLKTSRLTSLKITEFTINTKGKRIFEKIAKSICKWDLKNLRKVELERLYLSNTESFKIFCEKVIENTTEEITIKNGYSTDNALCEISTHSINAIKIYDLDNTYGELLKGFVYDGTHPHKGEVYGYSTGPLGSGDEIEYYYKTSIACKSNSKMFDNLKELHICKNTADSDEIMQIWTQTLSKNCIIKTGLDEGLGNDRGSF